MGSSLKFRHIEENLVKLLMLIANSQPVKRYVKYLDNNPLDPSKPDINEGIVNKNILMCPFDDKVLTNSEIKMFLFPIQGDLNSKYVGKHIYILDILCPYNHWLLENRGLIRPIRIADEVSKLIDNQKVAGLGDVEVVNYKSGKLNDTYGYFTLSISVDSTAVKGS